MKNKEYCLNLNIIKYKLDLDDQDYRVVSYYIYAIWRTRNCLKYLTQNLDSFSIFKNIFNKWYLSKNSI